jgi:glycosyltransferase involved in cell wall biosynthesis
VNKENPIVLVGPAFPLRGGIANFNESFARSLQSDGYRVELVSFSYQYPSILFPGKSQKAEGPPPNDLSIHEWISSVNPASWGAAARKIKKLNPSMVVIRFWLPFMGPALGTIAKICGRANIPVIGLVDNAIPHEKRPLDRQLSAYFFKYCDAFFTLSKSVAEDLKTFEPQKSTETSPHPIYDMFGEKVDQELAREKLGLDKNDQYVLFFGFIRKYKGLDLLLEAFTNSKLKSLSIKLIIAGEFYDSKNEYLDYIASNDLQKKVILFDDFIPQNEVKYYFSASNLVAQTYRSATQSGVTQIAYNFDKPMIVTNVGGLAEIVPDGKVGYVVEPNAEAIARALIRFFEEGKEAEFSKGAADFKEVFSWSYFTRKFLRFTKSLEL